MDDLDAVRADVYGETFANAKTQMDVLRQAIADRRNKGFGSAKECAQFAKEHHLDILVYSSSQKTIDYITEYGESMTPSTWRNYFSNVLFYEEENAKGKRHKVIWTPEGNEYYAEARQYGEDTQGLRRPLSHRNYVTPTGYYDPLTGTFNVALPMPVFAKETGADTSHIYELVKHVGMECADYLLAWLRLKMMYPHKKTEIVPIITSRTQGNGKSSIANALCAGMFGEKNVIVSDKIDLTTRFNADFVDALIVCAEEKHEDDKRLDASSLKSVATSTTTRKEYKGRDPIYQNSYTEYMVTTNKDVPIKLDNTSDQRRFMIIGADDDFVRKPPAGRPRMPINDLADEVFVKLYGTDRNGVPIPGAIPFTKDAATIAQFKHELFNNEKLANLNIREFPQSPAYHRCYSLPRTNDSVEIESIIKSIAPFIRASLTEGKIVTQVQDPDTNTVYNLADYISAISGIEYVCESGMKPYLALCRPIIFYDRAKNLVYPHATVERVLLDCRPWLMTQGLQLLDDQESLPKGFTSVASQFRFSSAARFGLYEDIVKNYVEMPVIVPTAQKQERIGARLRVNSNWKVSSVGEFETVNEMRIGIDTLENKNKNVQYMDNFLFEADDPSDSTIYSMEQDRLNRGDIEKSIKASSLFDARLRVQKAEADRLLAEGIAWRAVYSGGKSIHILVQVRDAPTTLDEYKWLHAHLCTGVISKVLTFDPACNDPARLTRAPISFSRSFMYQGRTIIGMQELYAIREGQVFDYNWRPIYQQWLNRPLDKWELNGRKLMPCKQEYKDAMVALLTGTFWTDDIWNGRRQVCFFPGYRLCRLNGFTHEILWSDGGILDGLEKYYRSHERDYWRTRENCALISEIDAECGADLDE